MSKVTSKLQITIPKRIADEYGISPGDEIDFQPAGEAIRLIPAGAPRSSGLTLAERLRLFDRATERQRSREATMPPPAHAATDRGWTRDELYERGKPR
jgi:AbrB family looped-hinge helix DNA binding protein